MSFGPFITYDPASGAITGVCSGGEDFKQAMRDAGEGVLAGTANDQTQYVAFDLGAPMIADKEALPFVQSITPGVLTLTGLPVPCTIETQGQVFETTSGEAVIEFELPGIYTLVVRCEPQYFPQTIEVEIP